MRNLDTPIDDGLAELAHEMVAKRLGLSNTVAIQIERYGALAERQGTVPLDEAVSVFRLVGRRVDAQLVFSDAGRRTARYAARTSVALGRGVRRLAPGGLRCRLGVREAAKLSAKVLDAELVSANPLAEARLILSMAARADALGDGCYFYGAAFAELLRLTCGFEGAMLHDACRANGDPACTWRAATVEGYP